MAARKDIKGDIITRVRVLYILFILLGVVIFARLVWVQRLSHEIAHNAERLEGRIFQRQTIKAHRGSILSREGEPLATSIFKYQVEMDFGSEGFDSLRIYREQSDSLAKLLSAYFKDRTVTQYKNLFKNQRDKRYKLIPLKDSLVARSDGWLAKLWDRLLDREFKSIKIYDTIRDHTPVPLFPRTVEYTEWQKLRRYPILNWNMGMTYKLATSDQRVYPMGSVGGRIIGKILGEKGRDYGIESVMSEQLAGRDGEVLRQRIARGFSGRVAAGDNIEAEDGLDVVTTLDATLMDVVDKALREQLQRQNALWGTAIIMEVKTGDILAMSNLGVVRDEYSESQYNYAIASRMEPGSTLKLSSLLALLEEGGFSEHRIIDSGDGDTVKVGRAKVKDSHKGYTEIDLHTAFAQSSNVYFAQAVYETFGSDPKVYTDYLKRLHMDRTVGLDAYGEPRPILPERGMKGVWTEDVTLPYLGFGYAAELTPIQTLTLYNAVANGGRMVAPRIVRELRRGDKVVERFPARTLVQKIASNITLEKAHELLVEVVDSGTAKKLLSGFKGIKVAAKTGTAQFAQGDIKYEDGYYLGSMVGYIPAHKPKYSVMVAAFTHRSRGSYYGVDLAGAAIRDIMRHLYNKDGEWLECIDTIKQQNYPKHIKGGSIEAIRDVSSKLSPHTAESPISKGWGQTAINNETAEVSIDSLNSSARVMPNVIGMGLKDALFILESRGLRVNFSGKGGVTRQSIAPGREFSQGAEVTITLR